MTMSAPNVISELNRGKNAHVPANTHTHTHTQPFECAFLNDKSH